MECNHLRKRGVRVAPPLILQPRLSARMTLDLAEDGSY